MVCTECNRSRVEHSAAYSFDGAHPSACQEFQSLEIRRESLALQTFKSFPALVAQELFRARLKFPVPETTPTGWTKHQLMHYWLAVIEEEFEELKAEVFGQQISLNVTSELTQLAAMCQRAAESCDLVKRCK
jgi:hypothetical protein